MPGSTEVLIKPLCSEGDDTELGIVVAAQANSGVDTESCGDVDALGSLRTCSPALLGLAAGLAGGGVETKCEAVSSTSRCRL
jgi:hypothetical protein